MKKTIFMLFLALVSWGASAQMDHSMNSMGEMKSKMTDKSAVQASIKVQNSKSGTSIIANYLALKDALVVDNSKKAADAGKMLFDAIAKFDLSTQPDTKQKELSEIIEDASENAEHISENGNKIEHQREHFEMLSNDIHDLILIIGSDRSVYLINCPMYNNKKGANWLSASSMVANPYLGSKMPKCGSVQQEILVK